ncbi:leucine--tRNA ligase [Winogradskyella immobilis]|uniref:Leucine--tRNA ligase n=1 Tax=Winogradskyella immobilis TaxID=2816852 RepID=A0ABS8EL66_9FLAO|nr:class I tRNA ligase family protein [Winogradskyella immobilis]MCC1483771.1 leucine--tRNA ligase [Winogradskyella immobilis]MCG0015865.1 leucine--tRNA ligase [Winogradskyella immobilis]
MRYDFNQIEKKWQDYWAKNKTFKAVNNSDKPKYYVLDMFPYPSGAGLHVGHPLGYIASDIYARYKRHKGFNVLHPQGYDSFGLPAEQYAIQTGQHPAVTTEENIKTYRRQLDQIGFSFDWSREVRTSNPEYYKWTQWIFIQLFESYYCYTDDKAKPIEDLVAVFSTEGNANVNVACDDDIDVFKADQWNAFSSEIQQKILLKYRLTYLAETEVNWCPALGTVLANDEIVNGVSERGGHPVVRKKMTQWSMRISAYAERLLQGLDTIDWTDALKESQRNWIGKSVGASVTFNVIPTEQSDEESHTISVFTTRPDTIYGVSFMTLAPEHEYVSQITTPEQKEAVDAYVDATAKRSERDRMADVKTISGVFTGAYAEHPFTKEPIPIWIGDYVLASYGTGAVMAVPCGDQRDYDFAKHFNIDIPNIFEGVDISDEAYGSKDNVKIANSDFLNGMNYKKASKRAIYELEQLGQGEGKINYRLRDAVFSRQRYWGEPFPVYYVNGMPQMIDLEHLPLQLPEVEKYLPTEEGEPPLGRADVWAWDTNKNEVVSSSAVETSKGNGIYPLELNTMPGWAGSSWYFFRYMEDAMRDETFASEDALKYWENVDLYIGGSEHATGHLLYSRFWVKFMHDRGFVGVDEPFKKLINQGMILGTSAFVYRLNFQFGSDKKGLKYNWESVPSVYIPLKFQNLCVKLNDKKNLNGDEQIVYDNYIEKLKGLNKQLTDIYHEKNKDCDPSIKVILNTHIPVIFPIHVKVDYVNSSDELNISGLKLDKEFGEDYIDAIFIGENGQIINGNNDIYKVGREVEKMSKSKYNVVNPDNIVADYGADSLRLYEMFLGPLEQYKPWNTAGITGVHSFLKKLWKLYHQGENGSFYIDSSPLGKSDGAKDNLKTLHKTIKKVEEDIENFSFNTSVSTFMIAVNELTAQKCTSKEILQPLLVLISPYAPHIAEELWEQLGNADSISTATFPKFDESHLVESSKNYPISFNGKMRFTLELPLDMSKEEIEKTVLSNEKTITQLQGRAPKKVIVVPGKIVNIVG